MTAPEGRFGVSRNTLVLGWVSFFTDVASEMIYVLLPMYLVGVLGANRALVGLIEGTAESTASLLKFASGWLADLTGRNKLLTGLGYGISAFSRPVYGLVAGPWQVLALRFADRVGKGIRSAPRDALILATSTPGQVGRAFGFHRAFDQAGAVLGPALAMALLPLFHGHYPSVFVAAAIPGFVSVYLVAAHVQDAPREGPVRRPPATRWAAFDPRLRRFLLAAFVFALANSSDAFLILRVQHLGVPALLVPLSYLVYNVVYVATSLPAGMLSDRIGRPRVMLAGYGLFVAVYLGFALATRTWQAWALFAAYGLFAGLNEGVQRAWVGDLATPELRGSAYGAYHLAIGVAALPASLLAGSLWDRFGPGVAFGTSAGLAAVALLLFGTSLVGLRGR